MKKLILVLFVFTVLFTGCGNKETELELPPDMGVSVANPWVDVSREDMLLSLGFDMKAPDGGKITGYQLNEREKIGQLTFKYGEPELEYVYRMKSAVEFEDISGLYYQWDVENEAAVSWCEAKTKRAVTEEETVEVCLWYDVVPGFMYSLSTSAADLDGFDISAIAEMVFEPMQGDAGGEAIGEEFIPSNFLEARLNKGEFDSFDEIIDALEKDNAYARVRVYGYDEDILLIAENTYDYGDGLRSAIEVSAYAESDGAVKSIGGLFSGGTAYPISIDDEGKLYSGGNTEVNVSCISKDYTTIMYLVLAYISYDEDGNSTYGGFIRESNTFDGEEIVIAEDDSETLEKFFAEYQEASPIGFTAIE